MEVLNRLEDKIDELLQLVQDLEQENQRLRDELTKEQQNKENVLKRLDDLLQKLQDVSSLV